MWKSDKKRMRNTSIKRSKRMRNRKGRGGWRGSVCERH